MQENSKLQNNRKTICRKTGNFEAFGKLFVGIQEILNLQENYLSEYRKLWTFRKTICRNTGNFEPLGKLFVGKYETKENNKLPNNCLSKTLFVRFCPFLILILAQVFFFLRQPLFRCLKQNGRAKKKKGACWNRKKKALLWQQKENKNACAYPKQKENRASFFLVCLCRGKPNFFWAKPFFLHNLSKQNKKSFCGLLFFPFSFHTKVNKLTRLFWKMKTKTFESDNPFVLRWS